MQNYYLVGKRRAGKDTVGEIMQKRFGFEIAHMTTPIYEIARAYFGMVGKDRALLQSIGDALRQVDPDVLLRHVMLVGEKASTVCADVRLHHEGEVLHANGWIGIRIERPEAERIKAIKLAGEDLTGPVADHATEQEVDHVPVDYVIWNAGTLDELAETVSTIVR